MPILVALGLLLEPALDGKLAQYLAPERPRAAPPRGRALCSIALGGRRPGGLVLGNLYIDPAHRPLSGLPDRAGRGRRDHGQSLERLARTPYRVDLRRIRRGILVSRLSVVAGCRDRWRLRGRTGQRWWRCRSSSASGTITRGPQGVLDSGVAGLILGAAYMLSGRNLWAPILAHGLIDTVGVVILFFGWDS
mgnify:CR=1 FL=1